MSHPCDASAWQHPTAVPLVIAAVRPGKPDAVVLRSAADLALDRSSQLLVIGKLDLIHLPEGVHAEAYLLDASNAELFAECAALLLGDELVWSVAVLWGHLTHELIDIARRQVVSTVVIGPAVASRGFPGRVRRGLTGSVYKRLVRAGIPVLRAGATVRGLDLGADTSP